MSAVKAAKLPIADEATECRALIEWVNTAGLSRHPELQLLYHIPNGGWRHEWTGYQLKRQGLRSGMPDYHLPVGRGGHLGLFLEMKRRDGGRLESDQRATHLLLRDQGNRVEVCLGWEDAVSVLQEYLAGAKPAPRGCSRFHSPFAFDD